MIANKLNKLAKPAQKKINDVFLNLGLCYYMGGNWRLYLKKESSKALGTRKEMCEMFLHKDDASVERAITIFLGV